MSALFGRAWENKRKGRDRSGGQPIGKIKKQPSRLRHEWFLTVPVTVLFVRACESKWRDRDGSGRQQIWIEEAGYQNVVASHPLSSFGDLLIMWLEAEVIKSNPSSFLGFGVITFISHNAASVQSARLLWTDVTGPIHQALLWAQHD
ncbi:hypothetical protein DFH09DRAFT_1109215 [Mycena vulgaris]|nr:hypothetical protein DFH09DRAFT_1109215 [Mycena vulgaris]